MGIFITFGGGDQKLRISPVAGLIETSNAVGLMRGTPAGPLRGSDN
jgi:hypothetical protein